MDGAHAGSSSRRAAAGVVVLAGLLLLVALAAAARRSTADGSPHPAGMRIVGDILVVLLALVVVWGLILRILALRTSRPIVVDEAVEEEPLRWWEVLLARALRWGPLAAVAYMALRWNSGEGNPFSGLGVSGVGSDGPGPRLEIEMERLDWPAIVIVVLAIAGGTVSALVMSAGRTPALVRSKGPLGRARDDLAATVAAVALHELRAEPDPRLAIIRAYQAMEAILARSDAGLDRRPAETPFEYLDRALVALGASGGRAHRLTDLFEQARFSDHVITEAHKEEAIAAVEALQLELTG